MKATPSRENLSSRATIKGECQRLKSFSLESCLQTSATVFVVTELRLVCSSKNQVETNPSFWSIVSNVA